MFSIFVLIQKLFQNFVNFIMKITNTNLKLTEDVIFTNFSKNEGS